MFEKFGHVLNISESEPSVKNLSSISIAQLEAKGAMALKVRDSHFLFFLGLIDSKMLKSPTTLSATRSLIS